MDTVFMKDLKETVLSYAGKMRELNLTPLTQGNISARDKESGLIVITPHDYPYDLMSIHDLVVIDASGKVKDGFRSPSEEAPVHCRVYQERPEVMGVVHTEPVYTNAFGALEKEIEPVFVNMALDVGGSVPVMPFADSGNADFGTEMLKVMGKKNAVIWAAHGLLTVGETLGRAFHCTVMVEMGAQIYHISLSHGTPIPIEQTKIDELTALKFG